MENQKKAKEISIAYLFKIFKKCLIFMIIAAILAGAIGVGYSVLIDKPQYESTLAFWVANNSPGANYTSQSLVYAAAAIASSCIELVNQDLPVRTAVEEYNLAEALGVSSVDECVAKVRKMLRASKEDENSVIFYVKVTSDKKEDTFAVANAIKTVMPKVLHDLCSIENESVSLMTAIAYPAAVDNVKTVKSSPIKLGIIFAFVAAVFVYALFFVLSIFDNSIYGEETIKENFDYPIVGNIPSFASPSEEAAKSIIGKFKTSARGIATRNYENKLLTDDSPFLVSESFNTLRTNVIYSAAAAKNPIFAVTSDIAAAGKTVVAANLAIALANLNKKVLLVECDMRCPTFTKLFGIKREEGLSELLAGMVENTAEVVNKYADTGLDVLFCGKIPPNPSELLSGFRMTELSEQWRSTYDYVILDMPPIGEVYDAGVVAGIVNGYIITARVNHSNVSDVREAIDRVQTVNGEVLGIIVNGTNPKSGKKYKYYSSYDKAR